MPFVVLVVLQVALIYFHNYSSFEQESNWMAVVGGAKPPVRFWVAALLEIETAALLGLLAFSMLPAGSDLSPLDRLESIAEVGLVLAGLSAAIHHNFNAAIVHFPSPRRMAPYLGAALAWGAVLVAWLLLASVYFVTAGSPNGGFSTWGQAMGQVFIPAFLLGLLVFVLQGLTFFLRVIPLLGAALNAAASSALLLGYFQAVGLWVARAYRLDFVWPGLNGLEVVVFGLSVSALSTLLAVWLIPKEGRHPDGQQPPSLVVPAGPSWKEVPQLVIDDEGASFSTGALRVKVRRVPFSLTVTNPAGEVLAQLDQTSLSRDLLAYQCLSIPVLYTGNTLKLKWRLLSRALGPVLSLQKAEDSTLLITFRSALLRLSFHEPDVLRITLGGRTEGMSFWERRSNAWSLSFPIASGAHFLGFGQRFNRVDQRGGEVYSLVEEGGVGYAGLAPVLKHIFGDRGTFPNGAFCTSFPVPFTLMSRQDGPAVGWFWNTYSPSWFKTDGPAAQSAAARLTVLEDGLDLFLCAGPSPLEVVRQYTGLTGRPLTPPPWVLLPWKTRTGPMTETEVLEDIRRYRELDIPLGQVGVENWQKVRGSYEFNPQTYPHLPEMMQEAGARGYHIQIWHFPYMNQGSQNYRQGLQKGYFLRNRLGLPYLQRIFHGIAAVIDYSNPQAARWHEQIVQKAIYENGFSGTMTDYGESIPPDCVAYNGQAGLALRNAYPVMYCQSMQRAARAVRGDDYLVYPRAGYAASQRYITAQFPGDQDTDWDDGDGLPAAVRAMLNVSMCGFPVNGSDIGGWFDALTPFTTKELFLRWAEVGACSPLMRTHGGIFGRNREPWKFDGETVDIFRALSQEHVRLFPYLYSLAVEAGKTGQPIVIHPALLWPGQAELYAVEDSWMLGEALYVAPVLRQGNTRREVFLPPGEWWDLVRNQALNGPARITVDAPLGCTPRFLRRGFPLPRFASPFDTFMEGTDGRVGHLKDALEVWYYPGTTAHPFRLFDGTVLDPDLQDPAVGSHPVQWKNLRS